MSRDFLIERADETIRSELIDLLDTYHHFWDVPAEVIQNSVDAVRTKNKSLKDKRRGLILIEVDATNRSITVEDNGVGISSDQLDQFLVPGGGSKRRNAETIGEKGVGLTYCIFSSNNFELSSTVENGGICTGKIANGYDWLYEDGTPRPLVENIARERRLHDEKFDGFNIENYNLSTGTEVKFQGLRVSDVDTDDFFEMSPSQLRWLLVTMTAIGDTENLWNEDFQADFDVFYRFRLKGNSNWLSGKLDVGFPRIHTYLESVELSEVEKRFADIETRQTKTNFLHGKAIWTCETIENGGKPIRVYCVMLPGNNVVKELALKNNLIESKDEESIGSQLIRNSIFMATKRMPTGVEIPAPTKGKHPAYYKRCIFIVENDYYKFDMGRKSVNGHARNKLRDAVATVFQGFEQRAKFQGGEGAENISSDNLSKAEKQMLLAERWKRVEGLVNANIEGVKFAKIPDGQEAAVAAIFHELIGANRLKKYIPCYESYGAQYDLMCKYRVDESVLNIIIEFKYSLDAVIKDFNEGRKNWDAIDLLVCWDYDEQKLKKSSISISPINEQSKFFEGSTHMLDLNWDGVQNIPVMVLSRLRK